jgi:dihydrodipicolinate synthase/N-acetylneuraminate lyase
VQLSLHPKINHSKFRVYSGFGQQLGPIVVFNAGGVIDGLAAIFPKTVSRLFSLAAKRPLDEEALEEVRRLLMLRDLEPDSDIPGYDTYRGHPEHPSHAHPDIAAQLAAARARHDARLLAYA